MNIDYAALLNQSFKGDSANIIKLSTLQFGNSANAENGSNLIQIVDSVGESRIIRIIKNCTKAQKNAIYYNLMDGLDYTSNQKYKNHVVQTLFPNLYIELKS